MGIIHRPAFNLNHTMANVRTSLEAHYISAMSPTGRVNAIYRFVEWCLLGCYAVWLL
jgi:hypothetical protein